MTNLSFNENRSRRLRFRRLFWPGAYGFASEATIALAALVLFNLSDLSGRLVAGSGDNIDPLALWSQIIHDFLDTVGSPHAVQQVMLFALWTIAGALIYLLAFRLLYTLFGVKRSVGLGLRYVRRDKTKGLLRWLESLHDFLIGAGVALCGAAALFMGTVICFGIASQTLSRGLAKPFPGSLVYLILSLAAALLSVRLVALGVSLLSRRFREWYTAD